MTCEKIDDAQWRLSFTEPEAGFIINVMAQLARYYQEDLTRLPPSLRAYWQGSLTRSTDAAKGELAESQEMLSESRAELRSERLSLVETWVREYEVAEDRDPWHVEVMADERDEFVAMLNDRRLMLALEQGITQDEMEADLAQIVSEARRSTILEIDVLGHFILVTLGPQIYRP